ncbi:cold shock domain-containing protein [Candidatus Uhrbacteria bacterium]|nr:cold shock domain-containing protein [Candidatus Uhrbacteria bacterium]
MSVEKGGPTGPDNKKNSLEKSEPQGGKIRGTIKHWNAEKGFGFLRLSDGREVFCHVSELCEHIRPPRGQAPVLDSPVNVKKVNQRDRGLAAEEVECGACAAPEQWELQPSGPEVFGVREMRPVCVNKPNVSSYSSTIPREEVERANEPFKLAKRKETLWNWSNIEDEFFREFGEPQGIRVEDENKIVLSYSHGEKIVSADSAMNSKHWEVAPSGQWKEEGESIKAEFIFPDISGAKVWRTVASLYINPSLYKEFELLLESAQQEVLAKVKEKILPPADIAEKRFNDFLSEDYRKKEIRKLRDDIHSLQAPGESFISSSTHKAQLYEPLSPDERRGDFYYEGSVTTHSLTVGARKKEQPHWSGDYRGGKSFVVPYSEYTGAPKETAEQLRDKLIAEKRQQLKSEFDHAKKMNPPSPDARLYTLDPEEWSKQYEDRWDEMQKTIEDQWKIEDAQLLGETKQSYEQYENVAKDLLAAREEVEQAERLARVSRVPLEYNARPDWGNVGSDTVEKMQEQITALHAYAVKLNELIPNAVRTREQEFQTEKAVREEEERQKKAKEKSEIEQFGASGKLLDIAKSLAAEAEQKLGLDRAQALFQDTSNAPYGRARRQADIEEALGKDMQVEVQSFYNFSRARDVDAILYAVTRILGGADVSVETSQPDKSSPESPKSEPATPEVKIEELPRLTSPDKKGWWLHELPNGSRHSDKLNKIDKIAYDAGERINIRCPSCPDNPLVGYVQK